MSTLQRPSQRRRNLPFARRIPRANSDPSGDLSMSSYLLRGQFVRMLAIAAFVFMERLPVAPRMPPAPAPRTGACRDARARHRACHGQRQADHRGRPRAGARRSRPAIRAAAGRAAPRRRLSAIIEIRLLADKAERRRPRQDAGLPAAHRIPARSARCTARWSRARSPARSPTPRSAPATTRRWPSTPPVNEVHARHILVKTKEEAEEIIKQLDGGAEFEDIAKAKSSDRLGRARRRPRLFGPGQMVPEFEKAAFALEVGAYTKEPVQSQFGWHVIKVEDKRTQQPPAFEQVKDQVRSALLRDKYFALVKSGPRRGQGRDRRRRELKKRRSSRSKSRSRQSATQVRGSVQRMSAAISPLAPKSFADDAADRGRAHRHGRSRHQIQEPHRRAADGVRPGHRGRRRLHPVEVPVGAGRSAAAPTWPAARRGRWSSIPAMPTPSPASGAANRPG